MSTESGDIPSEFNFQDLVTESQSRSHVKLHYFRIISRTTRTVTSSYVVVGLGQQCWPTLQRYM